MSFVRFRRSLKLRLRRFLARIFDSLLRYLRLTTRFYTWNLAASVGHMFSETDFAMRMELGSASGYGLLAMYEAPICHEFCHIVRSKNLKVVAMDWLYKSLRLCGEYEKSSVVDAGLGNIDIERRGRLRSKIDFKCSNSVYDYVFDVQYREYYSLQSSQEGLYPLRDSVSRVIAGTEAREQLGLLGERYIVVMRKEKTGNGSYALTELDTYRSTFEKLRGQGYKIVWCGREAVPDVYKDDVIHYSTSKHASLRADVELIGNSRLCISDASGFGHMVDTLGVPLVYINCFQFIVPGSSRTVGLPDRLRIGNGRYLTPKEQYKVSKSIYQMDYSQCRYKSRTVRDNELERAVFEHLEGRIVASSRFFGQLEGTGVENAAFKVPRWYWEETDWN